MNARTVLDHALESHKQYAPVHYAQMTKNDASGALCCGALLLGCCGPTCRDDGATAIAGIIAALAFSALAALACGVKSAVNGAHYETELKEAERQALGLGREAQTILTHAKVMYREMADERIASAVAYILIGAGIAILAATLICHYATPVVVPFVPLVVAGGASLGVGLVAVFTVWGAMPQGYEAAEALWSLKISPSIPVLVPVPVEVEGEGEGDEDQPGAPITN